MTTPVSLSPVAPAPLGGGFDFFGEQGSVQGQGWGKSDGRCGCAGRPSPRAPGSCGKKEGDSGQYGSDSGGHPLSPA